MVVQTGHNCCTCSISFDLDLNAFFAFAIAYTIQKQLERGFYIDVNINTIPLLDSLTCPTTPTVQCVCLLPRRLLMAAIKSCSECVKCSIIRHAALFLSQSHQL